MDKIKNHVIGLDIKTMKLYKVKIKVSCESAPREWYEIRLNRRWAQVLPKGYELLVFNKNQLSKIKVENLVGIRKQNIWIATPSSLLDNINEYHNSYKMGLLEYISYFIGDGHRRRGQEIVLAIDDIGVFDGIQNLCREVFGYKIPNKDHWRNKISNGMGQSYNVSIGNKRVYGILTSLGIPEGKKNDIVSIPDKFLKLPAKLLIEHCFLA